MTDAEKHQELRRRQWRLASMEYLEYRYKSRTDEERLKEKLKKLPEEIYLDVAGHWGSNAFEKYEQDRHIADGAYEIITESDTTSRNPHNTKQEISMLVVLALQALAATYLFYSLFPENEVVIILPNHYAIRGCIVAFVALSGLQIILYRYYKKEKIRKIILNNLATLEDIAHYMNNLECYIDMKNIMKNPNAHHQEKINDYLRRHSKLEAPYQQHLKDQEEKRK